MKKYEKYTIYAAKSELKSEVANSHLSWLWWILDPLLFMIVYSFVAVIVFQKSEPYLPVFIFIGYNSWNFFSACLRQSVKLVAANKPIVSKVYIPKFIIIFIKIFCLVLTKLKILNLYNTNERRKILCFQKTWELI